MGDFVNPWGNSNPSGGFVNPWSDPANFNLNTTNTNDVFQLPVTPDSASPSIASQANAAASGGSGGGGGVLGSIGNLFGSIYHHLQGGMEGAFLPFNQDVNQLKAHAGDSSYIGPGLANFFTNTLPNMAKGGYEGLVNPDQASQQTQQAMSQMNGPDRFAASIMTDPFSLVPVGKVLQGAKWAADAAHLTPVLSKGVDALKASPVLDNALVNGTKNAAGKVLDKLAEKFVPYAGTTDGVGQGLQDLKGSLASDQMAIENHLTNLAQQHGLTPEEVRQLPEVFEAKGSVNPRLQQAYQDLNNLIYNGSPLQDGFKIGTNAETTTHFNGNPILDPQKLMTDVGYYPQRYIKDMNPKMQEQLDQLIQNNNKGFSTSGPFGQERQFKTVGEAEANGFNPNRNAYGAISQRLLESSKELRTANFLQGLLDKGIISKEALPGMMASDIKPLSSYFTVAEKKPTGTGPLSAMNNESGAAFKPLTKIDDTGFKIPSELSKSAPRYRTNPLTFNSDMDKAAYIIGNTGNRSARDADFVKALMDHTGLSEPELRAYGQHMRGTVRDAANGVADGEKINIPQTISNLPEHGTNPWAAAASEGHAGDPNDFASLTKSLEQSNPADKVVKVNPYYVKPQDASAIKEYLDPSKPEGFFKAMSKFTNAYNKGFLLSPIPHGHNVTANGFVLGGAKPEYVDDAFHDIKNGLSNPWYEQATRNNAISGMRGGNIMQSVNKAMAPEKEGLGKVIDKVQYTRHDALWDYDSAIRTAMFRQAKEAGMGDAEAAAHTNKFMVDYNNTTPFENKYMKPLVPFYAWKKGNVPLQISQMINQTPKYAIYNHAKDAISQALSGHPTDKKGRIMDGETLSDGSQVALDPYNPMDEPGKILEKGPMSWLLGSMNPLLREAIAQGTSALGAYAPSNGIQNKFPIYNAGAPAGYNARNGIAHAINALNPLSGSAVLGEAGNQSNWIKSGVNHIADFLGGSPTNDLPTKSTPGQTGAEFATKILGGFSGSDNPAKDATNQMYQNKDNLIGQIKYMKQTGQTVPKALVKQAYRKIPKVN